jgi:hypothetical protein
MRKQNYISKMRLGILIFFLFPLHSFSQDISGVWVGHMYNDTTQQTIHYELAINDGNGKTSGYSHTTFIIDDVKNIGVKEIKVKVKKDRVYVEDEKLVYDNYKEPPAKGVKMFSFLTLSKNDSAEVLSGIWRTNATKDYNPLTGSVFLEKKKKVPPEQTTIVKKLIDLGLADQLAFLPPKLALQNTIAINEKKQTQSAKNSSSPANKTQLTDGNQPKPTAKEKADVAVANNILTNVVSQPSAKEGNEKTVAINESKPASKNNLPPAVTTAPKREVKKEADSKPINKEESDLADKNDNQTNVVAKLFAKESNDKTVAINEQKTPSKNNLAPAVTTASKPVIKKEGSDLEVKNDKQTPVKIDVKGENNNAPAIIEKHAQPQTHVIANNQASSTGNKKEQDEKQVAANQKINSTVGKPTIDNDKQITAAAENEKVNSVKKEKLNDVAPKSITLTGSPVINKENEKNVPDNEEKKQIVITEASNELKNEKITQVEPQKKSNSLQSPVVEKPKVITPPPAAELSKRTLETIRTVEIAAKDSLIFSLYDNGAIDGDTVSVLVNGQVIMPRVGLLATAISKTIYLTPEMGDSISVVMYAENLGSIPPNTGLLVIRDSARIYEIRFSGDLSKNSKIILIRKKKS